MLKLESKRECMREEFKAETGAKESVWEENSRLKLEQTRAYERRIQGWNWSKGERMREEFKAETGANESVWEENSMLKLESKRECMREEFKAETGKQTRAYERRIQFSL